MTPTGTTQKESLLGRTECTALRGAAILSIIIHNYVHLLPEAYSENEYYYSAEYAGRFLDMLGDGGWLNIQAFLSFFGHYGVAVFLFLSGLGLGIKYGKGNTTTEPQRWSFTRYHYLKLLRLLVAGMVLFMIVNALTGRGAANISIEKIAGQLTMLSNLNHNQLVFSGPYWFFSLIMEIYIVYILLLHKRSVKFVAIFMLICVGIGYLLEPYSSDMVLYRYNFPGHMLPFCLGLIAASLRGDFVREMQRNVVLPIVGFIITIPAIMALDLCRWTWLIAPAAVCLNAVFLGMILMRIKKAATPLVWLGGISAMIFVVHPAIRHMFLHIYCKAELGTIVSYLMVTIAVSWWLKQLMEKVPMPKLK